MAAGSIKVKGLRELQRDLRKADKQLAKDLRSELKEAGDIIRTEASSLFSRYDARSAAGYRTRVRQKGTAVEQSLKRTTGKHPQWGALQMRVALLPARSSKAPEVERRLEDMLDRLGKDNGF